MGERGLALSISFGIFLFVLGLGFVTDCLSRQTRLRGDTLLVLLCGDESNSQSTSHCAYCVRMKTYKIIVYGRLHLALLVRGFRRKEVKLSS